MVETLKPVLLTGAGFTKDAGGFLAQEMWAQIFNSSHVQASRCLVDLLKGEFDYESIYDRVMYGDQFGPHEKVAILKALRSAYQRMDDRIRNLEGNRLSSSGVDLDKLLHFIKMFSGSDNARGHFFTLNQDLFIERWVAKRESIDGSLSIWTPGVSNHIGGKGEELIKDEDFLNLPTEDEMSKHFRRNDEDGISVYGRFQYLKLHGSWNWLSNAGGDVSSPASETFQTENFLAQ